VVAIILVNYQSYNDTLECLESISQSGYKSYSVFIVDNSDDKSGQPIFLQKAAAFFSFSVVDTGDFSLADATTPMCLINAKNGGFAHANNIVLKQILKSNAYSYAWLLNNDTKIATDTLTNYIAAYESIRKQKKLGILGCILVYESDATMIQGAGGLYYKFLGTSSHVMDGDPITNYNPANSVQIDYPIGASLLVSHDFLNDVGLMDERYFLYFEELDWVLRGRRKGWDCDYAPSVIIQHKAGKTLGGKNKQKKQSSMIADYYFYRNRLRFSFRYTPFHFPFVFATVCATIFYRILTGRSGFLKMFFVRK
jgi:GT2 family glycosyltransferase